MLVLWFVALEHGGLLMLIQEELLQEVPAEYRERLIEIIALTDDFCDRLLNDEYKIVCRDMAVSFCQEDSPVLKGKAASWACGLMYAVGRVNFLTDPTQSPHLKADEIAAGFGVSPATMHNKNREIQQGLGLMPLDPDFTIASRIDDNPMIWILSVNGIPMDIRDAPRGAQVVAYEQGLIPYIPDDEQDADA